MSDALVYSMAEQPMAGATRSPQWVIVRSRGQVRDSPGLPRVVTDGDLTRLRQAQGDDTLPDTVQDARGLPVMDVLANLPTVVEIHPVHLDAPLETVRRYGALLSPDELSRAQRFHFDVHRHRFIVGRGFLRTVLAERLGTDPREVAFEYGREGKPFLANALEPIGFNLTHCEGAGLVALGPACELGIDLEAPRAIPDHQELARQVFSEEECVALAAADDRDRAFLNGWTRKEAYIKAAGLGLSAPLKHITVSLVGPARLLSSAIPDTCVGDWTLTAWSHAFGIVALAVKARHVEIVQRCV